MDPAFQGRGLATEAVVGLLDCLFVRLGKHRVVASVDPRNLASVRLLKRLGMREEAHFRESLLFKGDWVDDAVFAILASEWTTRTDGHCANGLTRGVRADVPYGRHTSDPLPSKRILHIASSSGTAMG